MRALFSALFHEGDKALVAALLTLQIFIGKIVIYNASTNNNPILHVVNENHVDSKFICFFVQIVSFKNSVLNFFFVNFKCTDPFVLIYM